MSALANLQHDFQAFVLDGGGAIRPRIAGDATRDADKRLAIYRDGYRLRLLEALATDYEALKATVGDDAFDAIGRAYIEATPSGFRNLRWYGASLAEFLRDTGPWAQTPGLSELARFEWALGLAFDAPDVAVVSFDSFATLPPEAWSSLRLQAHEAVQLLDLKTNAPLVRKALDAETAPPAFEIAPATITWLVWRQAHSVHYRSLGEAEAWALAAVQDGVSFPEICAGLCRWLAAEEAGPQAAGWLRGWVDSALLTRITWDGEVTQPAG
ncbi:MAG: DNA-binding domain-containing protein [Betaproteobacteria bacterium]